MPDSPTRSTAAVADPVDDAHVVSHNAAAAKLPPPPLPHTSFSPSSSPGPTGFQPLRRSMTIDENTQFRRRPISGFGPAATEFGSPRRRSSTFSDFSLNDAKHLRDDILNPGAAASLQPHNQNNLASIPLAFALLPAVGGMLFKNGSAVITDVMLLGLAAVFLHWSVTQPWSWYHSAQEVRVREEHYAEMVIEEEIESDGPGPAHPAATPSKQGDVGGESEDEDESPRRHRKPLSVRAEQAQRALTELYLHEITALVCCFIFPLIGAYVLHTIRNQLSRPSEGLVSNYNLTIFLLAAEIHPLSHLIKLVQARTLHLQRIVNTNPFKQEPAPTATQVQELVRRLETLESRAESGELAAQNGTSLEKQAKQEAMIGREVRNAIQPDLDALNRAVRRYEKKATVLALQTEARLGALDTRLNDAISLAAAAAKNSALHWNFLGWLVDRVVWTATLPFQALFSVVSMPFRAMSGALWSSKRPYEKAHRDRRNGKMPASSKPNNSDRVPSRLAKR